MEKDQTNSFIPMEMGNSKKPSAGPETNEPAIEKAEEQVHFEPEKEELTSLEPDLKDEVSQEPESEPAEELKEEPKDEPVEELTEEPKEEPAPVNYPAERMILSPATVASKSDVDLPEVKVSNRPNIIKNIVVIVVALLLVGGIAGAVGYFLGFRIDEKIQEKD